MLAALSSQASGAVRQAVGGSLACLASGLQRRGFAAAAKTDSDAVTVEVGRPGIAVSRQVQRRAFC